MAIKRWNANTSTWELVGTPGTVTPAAIGAASLANANTFSSSQRINGNVGIGTAATAGRLALQSAGDRQIDFLGQDGNTYAYIGTTGGIGSAPANSLKIRSDAGGIIFGYQGFEQARIDTSGNLSLSTNHAIRVGFGVTDAFTADSTTVAHYGMTMFNSGVGVGIGLSGYQFIRMYTSGIERMRIASDGKVGIGMTPNSQMYSLQVAGRIRTGSGNQDPEIAWTNRNNMNLGWTLSVRDDVGGANNDLKFLRLDDANNYAGIPLQITKADGYILLGYSSSNGAYRLQVNSQIFATSSSIATSDGRYKENVLPITSGLDIIDSLNPVSFNWKEHPVHNFVPGKTVGFIAQEVKEALKDYEWVDNIIKTNYNEELDEEFLGIAESNIIPLLVAAVKELRAEVNTLKAQVSN